MSDWRQGESSQADYAVVIGRFQPVHVGHVALLQACLQRAQRVIVMAGSAQQPRSSKNPFTLEERSHMLRAALPAVAQPRLRIMGVRDVPGNDDAWVASVQRAVDAVITADGLAPETAHVVLMGHMKDASSYYLRIFARWHWQPFSNVGGIDATAIRQSYFMPAQPPDALWRDARVVPPSTMAFLRRFRRTPQWQALCDASRSA